MKTILLMLLCATASFGQIVQPTYYNEDFKIIDTVGISEEGYNIMVSPLVCTYNMSQEISLYPIYFIPYYRNEKHGGITMVGVGASIPDINLKGKNFVLKITNVACKEMREDSMSYVLNSIKKPVYDKKGNFTWVVFSGTEISAFCGTKEIEVTVDGKTVVPNQPRNSTDYFSKVNYFAEKISLQEDFNNSSE